MQKVHDSLVVSLAAEELVYGGICGNPPPNQDCQEFRNMLNDLTAKKNALAAKLATCPWWTKLGRAPRAAACPRTAAPLLDVGRRLSATLNARCYDRLR
jgi:hypothetical protein